LNVGRQIEITEANESGTRKESKEQVIDWQVSGKSTHSGKPSEK
jgi:hypothetical protein